MEKHYEKKLLEEKLNKQYDDTKKEESKEENIEMRISSVRTDKKRVFPLSIFSKEKESKKSPELEIEPLKREGEIGANENETEKLNKSKMSRQKLKKK